MSRYLSTLPVFSAALEAIADRTEDDLAADVALLPAEIRDRLAAGPLSYRYDCGICNAFAALGATDWSLGAEWWANDAHTDPDDPVWRVWAYHEVTKLKVKRRDQLHYGPLADEIYVRCVATYRAAGYGGDLAEPNA